MVDENTGFWVESEKKMVANPPLLRKHHQIFAVQDPSSARVGLISTQKKNILRTTGWFTAGIINFYVRLRMNSCDIINRVRERLTISIIM